VLSLANTSIAGPMNHGAWRILTRILRLSKSDLNSCTVLALRYGVIFQRLGAAVCL